VVAETWYVRRGTPELRSSWESWTEVWARTCGSVVLVSLKILKMSGIENCADRKGSIEIRLVGALGQASDEHGSWVAGAQVKGGRGRTVTTFEVRVALATPTDPTEGLARFHC